MSDDRASYYERIRGQLVALLIDRDPIGCGLHAASVAGDGALFVSLR